MRLLLLATRCVAAVLMLCTTAAFAGDKSVWNYEGGLFAITNGSIPQGPCFRLAGRVTSGDFFRKISAVGYVGDHHSRSFGRKRL